MRDVIIIGGGPAGAALGGYLSLAGVDNLVLERGSHPRPHVGESLVSATNFVLDDLGLLPWMNDEGFVRKTGAAWHPPMAHGEVSIDFSSLPLPDAPQPHSYHVDRAKFDARLFERAAELGSDTREDVKVQSVVFEDGQAVGVRAEIEGERVELRARIVVDASGRSTVIGNQLGIKRKDPVFDQFAAYGWFSGVKRQHGPTRDYIHIYFLPVERGWAWQIPITDEVTSIGVVADKGVYRSGGHSLKAHFHALVGSSPDLADAMRTATGVTELQAETEYSYHLDRFAGGGWLLVGDAARFVDPIFSSGVSVAFRSAQFASDAIVRALADDDVGAAAFRSYEERLRSGVEVWYEFIRLYYKLMNLFTHFMVRKEHLREDLVRMLQGEVFDRTETPLLDEMRRTIRVVESTPNHLWKSALTDVPID